MGKSGRKYRGTVPCQVLLDAVNTRPVSELLPIAKVVCGSDYAVCYYNNRHHQAFYHNEEAFRHAMRRCIAINAFDHCQQIIDYLGLEYNSESSAG